jgi:hypothetical protein
MGIKEIEHVQLAMPPGKEFEARTFFSFNTDEPLEGYDRIYVNDPFGNRIELMEPLSN